MPARAAAANATQTGMMKFSNRLHLVLWLALIASAGFSAPSSAQKGETAALSAPIAEISPAGKKFQATTLAQRQPEKHVKSNGPHEHHVAHALTNPGGLLVP